MPNSAYQLLLGACRLGCEPLVACLLSLPAMAAITNDELQKACDIATDYGHQQLADVLMLMVTMHSMSPGLVSRDGGGAERKDGEPQHVKEYYTAKDKLAKGGRTPEGMLRDLSHHSCG